MLRLRPTRFAILLATLVAGSAAGEEADPSEASERGAPAVQGEDREGESEAVPSGEEGEANAATQTTEGEDEKPQSKSREHSRLSGYDLGSVFASYGGLADLDFQGTAFLRYRYGLFLGSGLRWDASAAWGGARSTEGRVQLYGLRTSVLSKVGESPFFIGGELTVSGLGPFREPDWDHAFGGVDLVTPAAIHRYETRWTKALWGRDWTARVDWTVVPYGVGRFGFNGSTVRVEEVAGWRLATAHMLGRPDATWAFGMSASLRSLWGRLENGFGIRAKRWTVALRSTRRF